MLSEFLYYLKKHRRWVFLPLIAALALLTAMLAFSHLVPIVSPFIYTLF